VNAKPKSDKPMERRAARLAAVQALYQWEQSGASADTIVKEFAEHRIGNNVDGIDLPKADIRLFGNLVRGTIAVADDLDSMIAGVLTEDWSVDRLESILRAVLRGGAYELAHRTDIPPKVAISEYLAVADAFLDFIISPDAANIMANYGYASPSSAMDGSLLGPVQQIATSAVSSSKVQFVLGDLLPGDLVDEYRVQLQRFLQDPSEATVDAVLAAIEAKAATAY
jgi:transcription antitermination factor NusB